MSENLDQELDQIVERRKKVAEAIERLKGRKEQAESGLAAVEAECRAKNIDPDKIDDIIAQLEGKYREQISVLKKDTEEAERALAPFIGGEGTP
jgi:chromosome segregation ATPase